jgi:hydroxyethylthiazole kinase-like uncharacterized protein yjeF
MPVSLPAEDVTLDLLRRSFPIEEPDEDADKSARGRLLVVGGSRATSGAVLLAGIAALRAGAGKVRIATAGSVVAALGVAVPEAGVFGLPETPSGAIDGAAAAAAVRDLAADSDAVLFGTGFLEANGHEPLLDAVIGDAPVVFDAHAVELAANAPARVRGLRGRALIVPNPDEMQALGDDVVAAASRLDAVVARRGPSTDIASPKGECFVDRTGGVGLATSGSGDVAAGIAAGLLARGADPLTAALWMAHVHGRAGELLAKRIATVGFLARELLDEIPALLRLSA